MLSILITVALFFFNVWFFCAVVPRIKLSESHAYDKYNEEIDKKMNGWL